MPACARRSLRPDLTTAWSSARTTRSDWSDMTGRNATDSVRRSVAGMRVVIVGGGVAGVEAALALRDRAGGLADVTLVTPQVDLVHQSYGEAPSALGGVDRHPMSMVAERLGAVLVRGEVEAVDPQARR